MPPSGVPTVDECIEEASKQRTSNPAASQACSTLAIAIRLESLVAALDYIETRLGSIDGELEKIRFSG